MSLLLSLKPFPKFLSAKPVVSIFTLMGVFGALQPAWSQDSQPSSVSAPVASSLAVPTRPVLSISLPPQARLRFDVDAQDEDVLGVVKSALKGFNGQTLKSLLSAPAVSNATAATPNGTAPRDLQTEAMLKLLSDVDLAAVLQRITHLRVVVFETPRPQRGGTVGRNAPNSVIAHYEQAYINREGGRRVVRADFDDVQMLTVGFPQKGFAVVMQGPGLGVVVRANDYPNLDVGPLAMAWYFAMVRLPR